MYISEPTLAPELDEASAPAAVEARPFIRLRGVSKDYRRGKIDVPVLDRLDLAIESGGFVALMGSSGCGKTTLLNLIGGLDRPSSGTVEIAGVAINRLSPGKLASWRAGNVGFVFQFYNLLPALNARGNIELPLLLHSMSAAERRERVENALELVGLRGRSNHHPDEMSGGEQQRVAIARAIVADPDLLLCDEPTGDLDRASGQHVMEMLQVLNQDFGKTIVLVTHDHSAASCAKRLVEMAQLTARDRTPA